MEISRLTRDGTAEPVSRDQILKRKRRQGKKHFQLTTSRIGNLTRLILTLAIGNDYTYIHTKCRKERVGSVAANPDNVESNKEAEGGAQGTQGSSNNCTSRESVSPLSRLIRGFRNKYH